jgi:predicted PurR-regulated permease PerM
MYGKDVDPKPLQRGGRALPRQSQVFFFLILGFMLFMTWLVFEPFIISMVTGVFVAVLAFPIARLWNRILPKKWAAGLTMFTLFIVITVPLLLLGISMAKDATQLAQSVQSGEVEQLATEALGKPWAHSFLRYAYPDQNATELNATAQAKLGEFQAWAQGQLERFGAELVNAVPGFMVGITVVMFVVYYVLVDGDRLVAYLRRSTPLPGRQLDFLLREAQNGLHAVFMGQILTSLLQGVLGGIGFLLTGIPNAVLWGAVMAILALLPVVGTFMVWVPGALYLFISGNVVGGIFMLAWGTIIVMIFMDNVVRPRLIGNRADIHPMFVLVGVLGGAAVFGFIGLFLGPLLVGVTIAVLKVYEADYLDPYVNLLDEHESRPLSVEPPPEPKPDPEP